MSDTTGISWTQRTWNPWEGCTRISPGCRNCYMFPQLRRCGRDPSRLRRTGTWQDPDRWNAAAARTGVPSLVFTCSLSDFFHEDADAWRPEAWQVIRRCQHLRFQILTKRPFRIAEHLPADWGAGYENVWLGVSIEDDEHVWRADVIRKIPARTRFISAEPLLGPLPNLDLRGFHWLIVGGESGPGYRPMDRNWARQLRDVAKRQGVAFFFKQSAAFRPGQGDLLDGRRWREFPPPPPPSDKAAAGDPVERDVNSSAEDGQQRGQTEGVRTEEKETSEHLDATPGRAEPLADYLAGEADAKAPPSVSWEEIQIRTAPDSEECPFTGHPGCRLLTPRVFSIELTPIPACYLDDAVQRARWWNEIENQLELMVDQGFVPEQSVPWYPDGRNHCCATLAQKVTYPTPEEWEAYGVWTETRLRRQEEERQREEAERRRHQQEVESLGAERERQHQEAESLRAELQRQQQEEKSLRAELERQRQQTERERANWQARYDALNKEYIKASDAEVRWRIRADEELQRANRAHKSFQDLFSQCFGRGGFAWQTSAASATSSLQQDLAVLGLQWPCTRQDVKRAYHAKAKQYHPDRNPGDKQAEENFKKIQAAYERVRREFDRRGVQ